MSNMSVNAASSANAAAASSTSAVSGGQNLESEQFLMLLLAQLRNQNPLEPMGDKDLMGQITQMNSLQELKKINNNLETGARNGSLMNAAALIGKHITYRNAQGDVVSGDVAGVSMIGEQVSVWVGNDIIAMDDVIGISEAMAA